MIVKLMTEELKYLYQTPIEEIQGMFIKIKLCIQFLRTE
jgi:hypothetical protein